MTDTNNNEEIFGNNDFVFTRKIDEKTGNAEIIGGGYKVNSFFLQNEMPVLFPTELSKSNQDGGKVSSPFDNLAVPAGIFYINQRVQKKDRDTNDINNYYKKHETASDDMIDKLFGLVEADKKRKRKTRKHITKPHKRKTHKQI